MIYNNQPTYYLPARLVAGVLARFAANPVTEEIQRNHDLLLSEHHIMRLQFIKTAFWGITALLAVAIAGLIGYYQGFARSVGISDLDRTIPSLIADGVQMLRDVPGHVFDAGVSATTEWVVAIASLILATGFLAIALLAPKASTTAESSFTLTPKNRPDAPPDLAKQKSGKLPKVDDSVD